MTNIRHPFRARARYVVIRVANSVFEVSAEYPPLSTAVSLRRLWKRPPFRFRSWQKRSIPLSIAREKMRFPFEFLHLNEARGIRSRRTKRRKTESRIYIYTTLFRIRSRVALRPAPVIRLHPTTSIVFFHFSTQETASLVDLFISSCFALSTSLLLSVHRRLVVSILRPFRSISSSSVLDVFSSLSLDDDVEFRLDFDVAQEPPISGNWLRHGGLECSIQSFDFFFSMGKELLLFPVLFAIVFLFFFFYYSLYLPSSFPLFFPLPMRRRLKQLVPLSLR